ncbi:MAG: phage portal protein, partial [Dehalococcoidia bacterium]
MGSSLSGSGQRPPPGHRQLHPGHQDPGSESQRHGLHGRPAWSLEEVSRVYGVPKPLLSDLERATFANVNTAERLFWRNTMVPDLHFLEEQLSLMLLPRLGYPELTLEFDLSAIEALQEDENRRVQREV